MPINKEDIRRKYGMGDEDFDVVTALDLRPICEYCSIPLPPESVEARICSFECTFCASCVENVLGNVCPNCGGGFVPRPIRPARNWRNGNHLGAFPTSTAAKHKPVGWKPHASFSVEIRKFPPHER